MTHNYEAVKSKAGGLILLGLLLIVIAVILPFTFDTAAGIAVTAVLGTLGGALLTGGIIASVVASAIKPQNYHPSAPAVFAYDNPEVPGPPRSV